MNYAIHNNTHLIIWLSIQDAWGKLLESARYDQKDDFTVVLQPSFQEMSVLLRLVSKCKLLHSFWIVSGETECNIQLAFSYLGCIMPEDKHSYVARTHLGIRH